MYQHLTECKTHAENMQVSFCFCKTCICLKILENIQISVSMIDRLDITDEYSVKCEFILKTVIFIDAALDISLRKFWKCNILWFSYLAKGFRMRQKVWSTLRNKIVSFKGTSWDQFSRQGILRFNNHEIILECILQPTTAIIQAKSTGHSEDKLQNMFD